MNKLKSKKKKKVKPSDFSLQPEIVVLNQKKFYIQNLFVSFESLHKLSPDSPLLQIIQDNCALKAILLSVAISTLETNPEIQNEITKINSILSDYLDNYFIKNEKKIYEIIQLFDNGKNIPNEQKSQFEAVIINLKETIQFSKKSFQ